VRGDRPLQINWTRNGVDLGNRDNNTYTVFQMTFDHAGLYGCTAKNWAGKVYTCFWIDVTGNFGSGIQIWHTFQTSHDNSVAILLLSLPRSID